MVQSPEKEILRRHYLRARAALTAEQRTLCSDAICGHLSAWLGQAVREGRVNTIGLYAAFRGEVDLHRFAESARALSVRTAYPKAAPAERRMAFAVVDDESQLQVGAYGIREPQMHATHSETGVEPETLDWLLIPGVAFTASGQRLGYGGGYYDRFLPRTRTIRIGICFACQLADDLPQGEWDQRMDVIVSEEGIVSCTGTRLS